MSAYSFFHLTASPLTPDEAPPGVLTFNFSSITEDQTEGAYCMSYYSFFHLTQPFLAPDDALPGISASEEDFQAFVDTLRDAINTFSELHTVTYGDCIQATRYVLRQLMANWAAECGDA